MPPKTVVGNATLCEKALYLAVWASAVRFLEFSVKERWGYFWAKTLELANLSVKFMLFATNGFLTGEFWGLTSEDDCIDRTEAASLLDFYDFSSIIGSLGVAISKAGSEIS